MPDSFLSDAFHHYKVYGVSFSTNYVFRTALQAGSRINGLSLVCTIDVPFFLSELNNCTPVFLSQSDSTTDFHNLAVYRLKNHVVMHFNPIGYFLIETDRITFYIGKAQNKDTIDSIILGSVFAVWLELNIGPVLHGAALASGNRSFSVLGSAGAGKSSLASLLSANCPLISDDLLSLESRDNQFVMHPGYPQIRLNPDTVSKLFSNIDLDKLEKRFHKYIIPVGDNGFGEFCSNSQNVSCIYLLKRLGKKASNPHQIEFETLSPRSALLGLMRNSYAPRVTHALGLQTKRMKIFVKLIETIPVRLIRYRSDMEQLPNTANALLDNLNSTPNHIID